MPARRNRLLRHIVGPLAILSLVASTAPGQGDRPGDRLGPLISRPAAVSLVATLESLSVTASPASRAFSPWAAGGVPALTVTTAWTIPANCTTLRLTGYPGSPPAEIASDDPLAARNSDTPRLVLAEPVSPLVSGDATVLPAIAQPVGITSFPGSRIDNIQFVNGRGGNSGSNARPSTIYILAQAL
jgi:hypothetical protein